MIKISRMKKPILLGILLTLVLTSLTGCISQEDEPDIYLEMEPGKQYEIYITQEIIDKVGTNDIEVVFASVVNNPKFVAFRCDEANDDDWMSWIPSEPHNRLTTVVPDTYTVGISGNEGTADTLIIPYEG